MDNDLAHESDMRKWAREQLRLDCEPEPLVLDCDESVPYEPWPLDDLEF